MLQVGTKAPDFSAKLDDGTTFEPASLRGDKHLVLYFYPKDNTSGCTAEACSFRDNYDAISEYDAVIVGVSGDSEASHRDFKERNGLGFPLIADEDGRVRELYEAKGSLPGLRPRITYVIDKQGVIRAAFRHDIAIGRHLSDTLEALEALQDGAKAAG